LKKRRKIRVNKYNRYKKNHRNSRNYNDPVYKSWRRSIYRRDKHQCQWPGCKCKKRLNAHHIMTWSKYPSLRFDKNNGITLCYAHHNEIRGKEECYVKMFHEIIIRKLKEKE